MILSIRMTDEEVREAVCMWLDEKGFSDIPPAKLTFYITPNGSGTANLINAEVKVETGLAEGPYR